MTIEDNLENYYEALKRLRFIKESRNDAEREFHTLRFRELLGRLKEADRDALQILYERGIRDDQARET